jgi:hypothetical protein
VERERGVGLSHSLSLSLSADRIERDKQIDKRKRRKA